MKKFKIFLLIALGVFVFPGYALGFGITPAEIFAPQLKPGSHYEKQIYVTRPKDEANEQLKVVLDLDLGDMVGWFKFMPGVEFEFPTGQNTTSFQVIVDVPYDAELKNYKGQVTAKGMSDNLASQGVTIIKGAVLGVDIALSDADVTDLKVLSIKAPDVETGDPVRLFLNIQNSGNVDVAPDKVVVEVMDLFEKPLESLSDETLEKVEAFATKEIQAEFSSSLEKGQYRVDASVMFQGEEIAREKMILTVNAKPTKVDQQVVQPKMETNKMNAKFGMALVLLGVITLILILFIFVGKGSKSLSKMESKLFSFMEKNKLFTWILALLLVVMVAWGFYMYLSSRNAFFNKGTMQKSVVVESENSVEEQSSDNNEATGSSTKEVRGVSTQADDATLVVQQNNTPGYYPIYATADFNAEVVYKSEDGETFDVIEKVDDWYHVELDFGASGWLHESSIKNEN